MFDQQKKEYHNFIYTQGVRAFKKYERCNMFDQCNIMSQLPHYNTPMTITLSPMVQEYLKRFVDQWCYLIEVKHDSAAWYSVGNVSWFPLNKGTYFYFDVRPDDLAKSFTSLPSHLLYMPSGIYYQKDYKSTLSPIEYLPEGFMRLSDPSTWGPDIKSEMWEFCHLQLCTQFWKQLRHYLRVNDPRDRHTRQFIKAWAENWEYKTDEFPLHPGGQVTPYEQQFIALKGTISLASGCLYTIGPHELMRTNDFYRLKQFPTDRFNQVVRWNFYFAHRDQEGDIDDTDSGVIGFPGLPGLLFKDGGYMLHPEDKMVYRIPICFYIPSYRHGFMNQIEAREKDPSLPLPKMPEMTWYNGNLLEEVESAKENLQRADEVGRANAINPDFIKHPRGDRR